MPARAADAELRLDRLPGRVSQHLLHLDQRPCSLHVAELLTGFVLDILHTHAIDCRGRINDYHFEGVDTGQHRGSPTALANQDEIARGRVDITRPWVDDNRLN